MTEQEKDEYQDTEANELIQFAGELDFDNYIGDLEFRQNLEILKDRAGKLEKEQEDFKDDICKEFNADDESTAVGSPRNNEDALSGIEGSSLGVSEGVDGLGGKRSRRARNDPEHGTDWDSSTCVGDDGPKVNEEDRDMANRLLEMNPNLRSIHSEKSVQKVLEKQREKEKAKQLVDLVENLSTNVSAPEPVIVTSADTKGKAKKPVDPSMLPYLYRSPAI